MKLLQLIQLGSLRLQNAMAMAPMTRSRANQNGEVTDLTVLYYAQRASAGLIISEGINISEEAIGSPFTPGIYTQAQIDAWKKVTQAVHEKGGKIFAQLWHTGRVGHSVDRNGKLPVAPSAIAIEGQTHFTSQGVKPYEVPQAHDVTPIIAKLQQPVLMIHSDKAATGAEIPKKLFEKIPSKNKKLVWFKENQFQFQFYEESITIDKAVFEITDWLE